MQEISVMNESVQYIVVNLGQERFGIDISYVDNIVRMQSMTRVPKVAPYLKGVINLRGEVVPVMSLRIKMDLPADEYTKASRIIILKFEQGLIGVIVDEVKEVVTLESDMVEKITYDSQGGYVKGVGKVADGLISLLDLNEIISDMV